MEIISGVVLMTAFVICQHLVVRKGCGRCPALRPHATWLHLIALLWCGMVALKIFASNILPPPNDAMMHELEARDVAAYLNAGRFADAVYEFSPGNHGYRFFLGVFYAVTSAPEPVVYGLHAFLAFWGLFSLLETMCSVTQCKRVPLAIVALCCTWPSALYWCTANLKEGSVLWGICMMLRATRRFNPAYRRESLKWPTVGMLTVAFFRPHIAAAWMVAIGVGIAVRKKNIGVAVMTMLGVLAAMFVLQYLRPELVERFQQDGVLETLETRYTDLNDFGGSAIKHGPYGPIPVITGLELIFARPGPSEVVDARGLLAGLEVWALSLCTAMAWLKRSKRLQLLSTPLLITTCSAVLLLSVYFTYMYNMGLMVRQRIQVFPALMLLFAVPVLMRCTVPAVSKLPIRTAAQSSRPKLQRMRQLNAQVQQ